MPDRKVVIIHVEFGSVQGVEQPPDVDVHVIDLDTQGIDPDDLCDCEMASERHFHGEYPGERAEEWIMRRMEEV